MYMLHGENLTGLRYRDEIIDAFFPPYAAAIGNHFILMDDNDRPHLALLVEVYLENQGLEQMEWLAQFRDLNPREYVWE